MNQIDCESFAIGKHEINHKRTIIAEVLNAVGMLLRQMDKSIVKSRKWKFLEVVLEVPFGEVLYFIVQYSKGTLSCRILDSQRRDHLWWGGIGDADAIPAWVVPLLYADLPEIVGKVDDEFPEARIRNHFKFFSEQAQADA